jgi:hypothetical protein
MPDFLHHDMIRHVRYRNSDVEQKNDRSPNVETATNPCDKTSGRGDNVALSGASGMAVGERHREKQIQFQKGLVVDILEAKIWWRSPCVSTREDLNDKRMANRVLC